MYCFMWLLLVRILGIFTLLQVSDEGTAAPLAGKDISFGLH